MTPLVSQLTQALCIGSIGFLLGVFVTYIWFTWIQPGKENETSKIENTPADSENVTARDQVDTPPDISSQRKQKSTEGAMPGKYFTGTQKNAPRGVPRTGSMVAQIDEILQEMILERGLGKYGLRMAEDAQHGVIVWLGLEKYGGISSVPDPEIQSLIKEAVDEWQSRAAENNWFGKTGKSR
jgi:hypothetical protein